MAPLTDAEKAQVVKQVRAAVASQRLAQLPAPAASCNPICHHHDRAVLAMPCGYAMGDHASGGSLACGPMHRMPARILMRSSGSPVLQVEFYFSDSNLPQDKFLKEKVAENAEGCECRRPCSRPFAQGLEQGILHAMCAHVLRNACGGFA